MTELIVVVVIIVILGWPLYLTITCMNLLEKWQERDAVRIDKLDERVRAIENKDQP